MSHSSTYEINNSLTAPYQSNGSKGTKKAQYENAFIEQH
jgi:hypothetical protein